MSTKSSILGDDRTHVYSECFDSRTIPEVAVHLSVVCQCGQHHGSENIVLSPGVLVGVAVFVMERLQFMAQRITESPADLRKRIVEQVSADRAHLVRMAKKGQKPHLPSREYGDPLNDFEGCVERAMKEAETHRAQFSEELASLRSELVRLDAPLGPITKEFDRLISMMQSGRLKHSQNESGGLEG